MRMRSVINFNFHVWIIAAHGMCFVICGWVLIKGARSVCCGWSLGELV